MTHKVIIKNFSTYEGSDWPQILAIITASLASLSSGIFFTWPSPSIPILISDSYPIDITLEEASYLTILPAITMTILSPLSGKILNIIGRKKSLIFTAIPQLIAWALIGYGGSIYTFYVARMLNGIADSISFATVPCYISEVSTPTVRGTWGNAMSLCIYIGNFLMIVAGPYLSMQTISCIFAVIPVLLIILTLFLPETPYFLIMKGKQDEAKKSLQWLRRKHDVDDELKQLTTDIDRQLSESGRFKDLFTIESNRKALLVAVIIRGAQQYSGIAPFSMYTQIIFEKSDCNIAASTAAIIVCGVLVLVNFPISCLLEKIGRRTPMIVSCIGCSATLALLTIFYYLNDNTEIDLKPYNLIPLILLIVYIIFFSVGLGIVPILMLGELFSSSIKEKALSVATIFFGIYVSTSSNIFSYLLIKFGIIAPFGFFAVCNFLSALTSYYFVPETKNKTLEQIQQEFKNTDVK